MSFQEHFVDGFPVGIDSGRLFHEGHRDVSRVGLVVAVPAPAEIRGKVPAIGCITAPEPDEGFSPPGSQIERDRRGPRDG